MGIEKNGSSSEVQQQELQELQKKQMEERLELNDKQGENLEHKDALDKPPDFNHKEVTEKPSSNRDQTLDEKKDVSVPQKNSDFQDSNGNQRRFEDYSSKELQQMREENQYKLDNLNSDFRERYEAEMYGMSQEEYQDYKEHLSRLDTQKEEEPEKEENNGQTFLGEYQESKQELHSSFSDKVKDFIYKKESSYDVDRAEAHGFEKGCFDAVPREYRSAVYEKFENAPDEIKQFINENAQLEEKQQLKVSELPRGDISQYTHLEIYMEKGMDPEEYADVFSHEYGHYYDEAHFEYSGTSEFQDAIKKDLEQYDRSTPEGRERFDQMLDDLFSSDAQNDRMISDNLSAYFKNDSEIMSRYYEEGTTYYQHKNEDWEMSGVRESEIYANSFSVCALDNKYSIEFMEKNFPYTWNSFKASLEE